MFSSTYKKILSKTLFSFFLMVFLFPFFASAQNGANNTPATKPPLESVAREEGNSGITYICNHGIPGECNFADLVAATMKVVDWGTKFAIGFSIIVIAYAGFKFLTSSGNPGEITKAKKTLYTAVIGIAVILCAWLIVKLVTSALGVDTKITTLG